MRFVLGKKNVSNVVIFAEIIRHFSKISHDVIMMFAKDYLYIQAMDSSHASLLEVRLQKTWFDEYNNYSPEFEDDSDAINIAINTKILYKVLQSRGKDQSLSFEQVGDKVEIHFPKSASSVQKDFSIPTIDLDSEFVSTSKLETQADILMQSKIFEALVGELSSYGDEITFHCTEKEVKIEAIGDTGKMESTIPMDDLEEYSIEEGAVLKLKFSGGLLQLASQFSKLSPSVSIGLAESMPLQLKAEFPMPIASGAGAPMRDDDDYDENKTSYLKYFIAPKVSDDTD